MNLKQDIANPWVEGQQISSDTLNNQKANEILSGTRSGCVHCRPPEWNEHITEMAYEGLQHWLKLHLHTGGLTSYRKNQKVVVVWKLTNPWKMFKNIIPNEQTEPQQQGEGLMDG